MNFIKQIEACAILLYGALTIIGAFAFAVAEGSTWGAAVAVLAAGATYVFQALQFDDADYDDRLMASLLFAPILLTVASLILTLVGA